MEHEQLLLHLKGVENIIEILHDSIGIQLNCLREKIKRIEAEKTIAGIHCHKQEQTNV